MIAVRVSQARALMGPLLTGDTFDSFLLQEATVRAAVTYQIDGRIREGYYAAEDPEKPDYEWMPWARMREQIFGLIRGQHTPEYLRFVLQLRPESALEMLQKGDPESDFSQLSALVIVITFEDGKAVITTGTSYHTFVPDKTADRIWDKQFPRFLEMKGIGFEIM
ncbi:MAG: DUF5721 family protein [Lachnospiraceae bacterium]|nr:DUF5721 family protein [Lachnospiraceae bacterium]